MIRPENVALIGASQTGTPTGGSVVPSDGPGAPPVVPGSSRFHTWDQLLEHAAVVPPLRFCDAPSPKGRWRCVRSPHGHDPDNAGNHVFGRGRADGRGGRS